MARSCRSPEPAIGVGHAAQIRARLRKYMRNCRFVPCSSILTQSVHVESLRFDRRRPRRTIAVGCAAPDARSAEIGSPNGVARSFQVSVNKVEPSEPILARNLLSKDRARSALLDEMEERRP